MQVADPGLIGRDGSLARIRAATDDAMAGSPRAVLVTGEAGIGKTRLVETAAAHLAAAGWRVLTGRAVRMDGGSPPYLPFVQVLEALIAGWEPAQARVVLGAARDELTALVPDLVPRAERVAATTPTTSQRGDPLRQARLFEALLDVAERGSSQGPMVVIIEDLQWADGGSADLLRFLVHRARRGRIVLLVTARTGEGDVAAEGRLRSLLTDLARRPATDWIELERLDRASVIALAVHHLGGADDVDLDAIVVRSGGNPLLVEELADAQARGDDLPVGIREAMRSHLEGLDAEARRVLRAAAAIGGDVDERGLAVVTDMTVEGATDAIRTLVDRRVLVIRPGPAGRVLTFRHELLREVVYESLLPEERRQLHRAIAEAGTHHPEVVSLRAAALATHWEGAGETSRANMAARAAHAEARSVGAFGEAVRWGRVALREQPTDDAALIEHVDLLRSTAEAALLIGDVSDATNWLREAIDRAPATLDLDRRSELHARFRVALFSSGRIDDAWTDAETELRTLPRAAASARAEALAHQAAVELARRHWPEARALAAAATQAAQASGRPARIALASGVLGLALVELGDEAGGLDAVRRAWAAADTVGARGHDLAYRRMVGVLGRTARFDAVVETARAGRDVARRVGLVRTLGRALAADEASALVQLGRWTEAEAILAEALAEPHGDDDGDRLVVAHARLRLRRDGPDAAADALDAALRALDPPGSSQRGLAPDRPTRLVRRSWLEGIEVAAEAAILTGEPGMALDRLAAASEVARTAAAGLPSIVESGLALEPAACLAVWAVSDRPSQPDRDTVSAAAVKERIASLVPVPIGPFGGYLAASLAHLDGDEQAELGSWPTVARTMTESGLTWWAAWASLRLAEARVRASDMDGAVSAVADASRIADGLPSVPLRSAVDLLARRLGIAVPSAPQDPIRTGAARGPLTIRERDVLALVVAGYANREIADRLAISHKTASVHVSNILRKLDVSNRAEAAAVAVRLGLVGTAET